MQQLLANGVMLQEELTERTIGKSLANVAIVVCMDQTAGEMMAVGVDRSRRERSVALKYKPDRKTRVIKKDFNAHMLRKKSLCETSM